MVEASNGCIAMEQLYHTSCFKCSQCGKHSLGGGGGGAGGREYQSVHCGFVVCGTMCVMEAFVWCHLVE